MSIRRSLTPAPLSHASDVASLASGLAAELRAGHAAGDAWLRVVASMVERLPGQPVPGADVVAVLRRWSSKSGWGGLEAVAICWELAETTGSGLAGALDKVADAMRYENEIALEVQGQLAVTRATTTVLATLPLLVVGLGGLLGVDVAAVLFGTPLGFACLAVGMTLSALGSWWVSRQSSGVRGLLRW
ncbi:MAG TPA: hypothetical protein VFX15_14540 [Actinomycetes bacterium]|nr:hypothetical protein [Actinomycetes bacterium]